MYSEKPVPTAIMESMREASLHTPAKLDTVVSCGGDTTLSGAAVERYDSEGALAAKNALRGHLDGLSEAFAPEDLALQQQVRQRLTELALAKAMVDQITGEIDRSGDIHNLEKELYGHYNLSLFKAALCKKIELLEVAPVPKDMELAKAALLDELEQYANAVQIEGEEVVLEQPSEETLRAIGEWLDDQFGDIFDEIDAIEGDELDAHQLVEIFNLAIKTTPDLRNNGWKAKVIERIKSAVSVRASSHEIVVPSQRRFSKSVAKNLIAHEVFGHALRSGVAESSGDEIGTLGTATHGEFEESLEIAIEQCLNRKYDPKRGVDHYVSIGLVESLGLSQEKLAQLTKSMHQIMRAGDKLTPDKVAQSEQMTEKQIRRTFAGMTDVDSGIAHRKDINYLHGLNGAWKLLNAIVEADQVDEGMFWLLSAKFNPFNPVDRELVNKRVPMSSSIAAVIQSGQ